LHPAATNDISAKLRKYALEFEKQAPKAEAYEGHVGALKSQAAVRLGQRVTGSRSMCLCRGFYVAALVFVGTSLHALSLDMANVTCGIFATASDDDIGVVIMWLRGYHAGKTGSVPVIDTSQLQAYGLNLGRYCKDHSGDLIIDASEKILVEEHSDAPDDSQKRPMSSPNPETGSEAAGKPAERAFSPTPSGSTDAASRKTAVRQGRRVSTPSHRGRRKHARRSS
jgi:HdeA/HdeB family